MSNSKFDCYSFAMSMKSQAYDLVPDDITGGDKLFIASVVEEYTKLAGEAIINDSDLELTDDECFFIAQVIAEWTFHKSVDIIRGEIPEEYREEILSELAYVVFEVLKQGISKKVDRETTLQAVEKYVTKRYKEKLEELLSENKITEEHYQNAFGQSNIDKMVEEEIHEKEEESHADFYSIEDGGDSEYLKDKITVVYGKRLAYKYLVRAAHVLKAHNCKKADRMQILQYLKLCVDRCISAISSSTKKLKNKQTDIIITIGMEIAFHRIVVLYKNNILKRNNIASNDLIELFADMIFNVLLNLLEYNYDLKTLFDITNTSVNAELKSELKEWLGNERITEEQFNKVLDKSYLVYLYPEIKKMMKFHFSNRYIGLFLVILTWVIYYIFRCVVVYMRHHQ